MCVYVFINIVYSHELLRDIYIHYKCPLGELYHFIYMDVQSLTLFCVLCLSIRILLFAIGM